MKGDGNIKILKFIGAGYRDKYQVELKIKENNKLIFNGITYNGEIKVDLKENTVYKIEAEFLNKKIKYILYVSNQHKYVFTINNIIINTITISLVDYYYNLPIERGTILLWQNQ